MPERLGDALALPLCSKVRCQPTIREVITYWICPVVAVDPGVVPAGNGDPLISVNPPFAALMLNTETLFEPPFATYKNLPDRSMVTSLGPVPTENGEPASGVKAPVDGSIEYAETLFAAWLATYANFPVTSIAIDIGLCGVAYGDPAIEPSAPLSGSMLNAETLFDTWFAT